MRFFKIHGPSIWPHMDKSIHRAEEHADNTRIVHKGNGLLGCAQPHQPSTKTCMFRGYAERLLDHKLYFISDEGLSGTIRVNSSGSWEIVQGSDYPRPPADMRSAPLS